MLSGSINLLTVVIFLPESHNQLNSQSNLSLRKNVLKIFIRSENLQISN